MTTRTRVDLSTFSCHLAILGYISHENPRRSVHVEPQLRKMASTRRNPVVLLLRCLVSGKLWPSSMCPWSRRPCEMSAGLVNGGWWSRIRPSCVSSLTTWPSHSEEVTVIWRKPVIMNSIEDLDTWLPGKPATPGYQEHHVSSCLPEDLGYLLPASLFFVVTLSCMTLESDKIFHKLKENLRRGRSMSMCKGWSKLGGRVFFLQSMTPAWCNIYSGGDDHLDGCEPRLSWSTAYCAPANIRMCPICNLASHCL